MQKSENRLKCHPQFLLLEIAESDFDIVDCISIVDTHQVEQQILIYKNKDTSEYEVRIYKLNSNDNYMSAGFDIPFKRYVTNNKFVSFYFETFYLACLFIENLAKVHPRLSDSSCSWRYKRLIFMHNKKEPFQ